MTPQERQLIDALFDRLAKVESAPRDAEAMSAIMQGLRNAPNAVYPLVQTVLLQDEALRRAAARIQELEQGQTQDQGQAGGFLDSMRDKLFGQSNQPRGSVPNVPPPVPESRPVWNSGQVLQQSQGQGPGQYDQGYGQGYGQGNYQGGYGGPGYGQGPYGSGPQSPCGGGGSFLGTAAATAAGVIGGSLLMNSIRGMMGGGHHHQAFGDTTPAGSVSPWGGDQANSSAARDLGVNDIGPASDRADNSGQRAGLFDTASNDGNDDHDDMDMDSDDNDGGDSDYA